MWQTYSADDVRGEYESSWTVWTDQSTTVTVVFSGLFTPWPGSKMIIFLLQDAGRNTHLIKKPLRLHLPWYSQQGHDRNVHHRMQPDWTNLEIMDQCINIIHKKEQEVHVLSTALIGTLQYIQDMNGLISADWRQGDDINYQWMMLCLEHKWPEHNCLSDERIAVGVEFISYQTGN